MRHILTSMVLVVLLFPALALGAEVTMDDLVETDGLYYQKSTDVPFTGKVTGKYQGTFKDGKLDGPWVRYHDNGQLWDKGDYKNGKREGTWVYYNRDGSKNTDNSGIYRNGKKVSD